jgi:formylglycine-generating enzyme required for sulfatase activity
MYYVSWEEAVDFCERLSQKENGKYRLPTEAEWEYACRAGTDTRFYYGNDLSYSQLGEYAWYGNNSGSETHPVGQKKPNAFGLYDMHGNVWEWCQDWYGENYYSQRSEVDPKGPDTGTARVLRGGSWFNLPRICRSASRLRLTPGYRFISGGFRVVSLDFK